MRKALVALIATASFAAAPPSAEAKWYLSKGEAQSWARSIAADNYGHSYYDTYASCRPQYAKKAKRGYAYHRWVCSWAADAYDEIDEPIVCWGSMVVAGSRKSGAQYRVMRGQRCDYE